jgi:hypothetical protein
MGTREAAGEIFGNWMISSAAGLCHATEEMEKPGSFSG